MLHLFKQLFPTRTEFLGTQGAPTDAPILEAINAHVRWRHRLEEYANGRSREALDHDTVGSDRHCALGRWIHGSGMTLYGRYPSFETLRQRHADFHFCAAQVVSLVQRGDLTEAQRVLAGDYARISRAVVNDLLQLNQEFFAP